MVKNKINFVTGETYTLAELFSGNRRIIIPDLQRDYCWGDETNRKSSGEVGELVTDFINNLIEQYEAKGYETLNLGLFYGYEIPANHIQLCDGQQRLTTLYLLLGMINKRTGKFRRHLISDYEYKHDDNEPYLNYAIRESSLYFLSDLVCKFFISNGDTVESIKNADWYFSDYDLDPSICSMINALRKIEALINGKEHDWLESFGRWILNDLTFLYFDMENRKNGEETFVIINTTGEPLSTPQTLKPLVINADINKNVADKAKKWEDIETWFWQNRQGDNDTADVGFNEFLRWVTMLQSGKESIKSILADGQYSFPWESIRFQDLYEYWERVRFLFDIWECSGQLRRDALSPSANSSLKWNKVIGQIDCFLLLPLIAYCKKWNVTESNDVNLHRFYKFIQNLSRIDNVGKSVNDLVFDAIEAAKSCRDIVELTDPDKSDKISGILLSDEEKRKLHILKDNTDREEIEKAFWKAQDFDQVRSHEIWNGQILPLINWSTDENGHFSLDRFKNYLEKFDQVFSGDCEEEIDDIRRALLTRSLNGYPRIFRGRKNYSFAWNWSDWHILINENESKFKDFFDDLLQGKTIDSMIQSYPMSGDWADFVHHKSLLTFCKQKNIQKNDDYGNWLLIEETRATSVISDQDMLLYEYLSKETWPSDWKVWPWYKDNGIVVFENEKKDFVFDIKFHQRKWDIQFFTRNHDTSEDLKNYIDSQWRFDDKVKRYEKSIDYQDDTCKYQSVEDMLIEMLERFDRGIL